MRSPSRLQSMPLPLPPSLLATAPFYLTTRPAESDPPTPAQDRGLPRPGQAAAGNRWRVRDCGTEDFPCTSVPNNNSLYEFVIDKLTARTDIADVRTSVIYEHIKTHPQPSTG